MHGRSLRHVVWVDSGRAGWRDGVRQRDGAREGGGGGQRRRVKGERGTRENERELDRGWETAYPADMIS